MTPFLALTAVFSLLLTVFGLRVSLRRFALKGLTLGDGGDDILLRRMRLHGNFSEYAPTMLIAVLALHLVGYGETVGWAAAASFLIARLAHAASMPDDRRAPLRIFAMVLQHAAFVAVALAILARLT